MEHSTLVGEAHAPPPWDHLESQGWDCHHWNPIDQYHLWRIYDEDRSMASTKIDPFCCIWINGGFLSYDWVPPVIIHF